MKHRTFQLETTTPLFSSGAEQSEFELRPPSFKGLLRFWWRAYFWGQHPGDASPKKIQQQMKEREGELFGTASDNGRKSRFSLRLSGQQELHGTTGPFPKRLVKASSSPKSFRINILEYLAYGTYEYQRGKGNVFTHPYLPVHSEFSMKFSFAGNPSETHERQLLTALYLLSAFGSMGAKSRNGFGSFQIKTLTERPDLLKQFSLAAPFPSREFLDQHIHNHKVPETPNFTALSKQMKIFALKKACSSWDECLAELGELYRTCKGKLDTPLSCQKRQYIGAPITIQQRIGGRWKKYETSFLERRSKPYFLRVIPTGKEFQGYVVYLPSNYCDGVEKDKYGKQIVDHHALDEKFQACCEEFNQLLGMKMEVYYG